MNIVFTLTIWSRILCVYKTYVTTKTKRSKQHTSWNRPWTWRNLVLKIHISNTEKRINQNKFKIRKPRTYKL